MFERNQNFACFKKGYLFPEINKRKKAFLEQYPEAKLISLGIGDTTLPLGSSITDKLKQAADRLGTAGGYQGYGPENGLEELREKIASVIYKDYMKSDEIFITDGAKCDAGRLPLLFNNNIVIAVQDPVYPVYVDTNIMIGRTNKILKLPCLPKNDFFPELESADPFDVLYFCSPNNPTGQAATRQQLKKLVDFAKKQKVLIIFDSAYSNFIQDPELPRSIYEIEGAEQVAIEIGSFSKMAGFTGLRLGWTIVPKELKYADGSPVIQDWSRIMATFFNGASNVVQKAGIAALEPLGLQEIQASVNYYMNNAKLIKHALEEKEIKTWGGVNSPYIWALFEGQDSWDIFDRLLHDHQIITTPGSGFGDAGSGFIRFSAFAKKQDVLDAMNRLNSAFVFAI